MTLFIAKTIWGLGCLAYYIIRYPHQRRANKTPTADRRDRMRERALMATSYTGLFVIPLIYVLTDQPKFASYTFQPMQAWLGVLVLVAGMALLYRTHRDLGRAWSITLEDSRSAHPGYAGNLRTAAPPDVCLILVVGALPGTPVAQLDCRIVRPGRFRDVVLCPRRPRGAHDAGNVRR